MRTARNLLNHSLKRNRFLFMREWPYKNIMPRIVAEQYLGDNIMDYKLFCFGGQVRAIEVDFDSFIRHKRNIYAPNWDLYELQITKPCDHWYIIPKPDKLADMIKIAEILSSDVPFLRVDMYFINNEIYIGELTFYHDGGIGKFTPYESDEEWGNWLTLPLQTPTRE